MESASHRSFLLFDRCLPYEDPMCRSCSSPQDLLLFNLPNQRAGQIHCSWSHPHKHPFQKIGQRTGRSSNCSPFGSQMVSQIKLDKDFLHYHGATVNPSTKLLTREGQSGAISIGTMLRTNPVSCTP
jgi:hypothetical protein